MQLSTITISFLFFVLADCASNPVIQGRIVGGKAADIKLFPYQVSLRVKGRHFCGGSIIAPDTILTAAHCADAINNNVTAFTISTGSSFLKQGTIHQVYEIQKHPEYNPRKGFANDVCKLKINPSITYSSTSQPIKLATVRPDENTSVVVSGWGFASERETYPQYILRAVAVQIMNQDECQEQNNMFNITNVMICAAAIGKDSCKGDSGGPLVDKATQEQVGVVSFGRGCARARSPGVYASVPDLLDFINA